MVLEEKIFENFECIFTLLLLSLLAEEGYSSFGQFESHLPKDDLCQLLAQWIWNRSQ
jgi:hypothetical protein